MIVRDFIAVSIVVAGLVHGERAQAIKAPVTSQPYLSQTKPALGAQDAQSAQHYQSLAESYSARQARFLAKSAEDKAEWERRRSQTVFSLQAKYPRPVDWARYSYEYDMRAVAKAGERAAHYRELAAGANSN
jgi:hypothetical protein